MPGRNCAYALSEKCRILPRFRPDPNVAPKPPNARNNDIGSGTALNVTLSIAKFQKLTFAELMDTLVIPEAESATALAALLRLPDRANIKLTLSPKSSDTV